MLWLDFKQIVYDLITVDYGRQGIVAGLERKIILGVIDIQSHVILYRENHETVYQEDDVVQENEASTGQLPAGAKAKDAYWVTANAPCKLQPYTEYDWDNRNDLICGAVKLINNKPFITVDPYGRQFYVYPRIDSGSEISIFWDGEKSTFADTDEVPFDAAVAEAVASYVKAWVTKEVDKDIALSNSYMLEYVNSRRMIYADARERARFRTTSSTPQPDGSCATCLVPDETVELVLFGDSGEDSFDDSGNPSPAGQIQHTEDVAVLVKSLRPDAIIHLGDCSYPELTDTNLQDHLTKYYYGWIGATTSDFWIALGNHDQNIPAGTAALLALLPNVASANSGKLYYTFTIGPVQFFVLNGGPTNSFDPDGNSLASAMGLWFQASVSSSSAAFKVVLIHKGPYSSDSSYTPGQVEFRWGFENFGIDLVMSGHAHNYERVLVNGVHYLISGTGGALERGFGATTTGSQFRYQGKYGVVRLSVSTTKLSASFVTTDKEVLDQLIIKK